MQDMEVGNGIVKTLIGLLGVTLTGSMVLQADDMVLRSSETNGIITFNEAASATGSYRVEWASTGDGTWTNFGLPFLDHIPVTGSGTVTALVPLWYRVVTTVTSPPGADDLMLRSFDANGVITFNEVTNGTGSYRVEWASARGTWTNFGLAFLNEIPVAGSGVVTASVPVLYRVVATVLWPPGDVLIPRGSFVMGATTNMGHQGFSWERPQHTVYVGDFFMDKYEVTKALWDEVANWAVTNGYDVSAASGQGKATNHPVQTVTWHECVKWCNARSQKAGLTPCYYTSGVRSTVYASGKANLSNSCVNWLANGYRLPTEAEWEKAARGNAGGHRYPWADTDTIQHARANYNADSHTFDYDTSPTQGNHPAYTNGGAPYTAPVGSFAANGYGLYDMAGNVWEWCWDLYEEYSFLEQILIDPHGPEIGPYGAFRDLRGGGWNDYAHIVQCSHRGNGNAGDDEIQDVYIGFRCVRRL